MPGLMSGPTLLRVSAAKAQTSRMNWISRAVLISMEVPGKRMNEEISPRSLSRPGRRYEGAPLQGGAATRIALLAERRGARAECSAPRESESSLRRLAHNGGRKARHICPRPAGVASETVGVKGYSV